MSLEAIDTAYKWGGVTEMEMESDLRKTGQI